MKTKLSSVFSYPEISRSCVSNKDPLGDDPWWEYGSNGASVQRTTMQHVRYQGDAHFSNRNSLLHRHRNDIDVWTYSEMVSDSETMSDDEYATKYGYTTDFDYSVETVDHYAATSWTSESGSTIEAILPYYTRHISLNLKGKRGYRNQQAGGTLQAGFGDGANFSLTQVGATIGLRGYLTHNDKFWSGRNGKVYSQNSLYKDYYGKGGKYVRGVQGLRNSANIASKSASHLTSLGRAVGYAGVISTFYDAVSDGYLSTGDVARIGIGILTIATPAGWVYGAADLGTQLITGQSITDRIGNSVDRHLVLWGQ